MSALSDSPFPRERGPRRLIWLVCGVFLCGLTIADPDLWGHTLYGLRSIERGVLTEAADPFSYTAPGARWVNHEWLTELQFGWLWKTLGNPGLALWRNCLVAGLLSVAWRAFRDARASLGATLLLLSLGTGCLADFVVFVRPQLATFLLFAVFLRELRRWWDRPTRRVWWLVPGMALWVNLHGGFLAGAGLLVIFSGGSLIRAIRDRGWRGRLLEISGVSAAAACATLLNPYGLELHGMLWHHLGTEQFVREWQPIWSTGPSPVLLAPFFAMALSLFGRRRWHWIDAAVLVIVSWQAVAHLRHVALLSLATLILLPGPLTESLARLFPLLTRRWLMPRARRLRWLATVAVGLFFAILQVRGSLDLWRHGIPPWEIAVETRSHVPGMPVRAVSLMRSLELSGNLITDYGWGQFAIWHLYPETRLAFDGRYRTVFPAAVERDFSALQKPRQATAGQPASAPILDEYPTEIALFPAGSSADEYLRTRPDWRCLSRDDQAALYVVDHPRFRHVIEAGVASDRLPPPAARWLRFPAGTAPVTEARSGTPVAQVTSRSRRVESPRELVSAGR